MPSHKVIDKQASRKGKASPSNASRVSLKGAGTNGALLGDLRSALVKVAIGSRAPNMQAYMKSSMPYHGVTAPLLRVVCRELFASVRFADGEDFRDSILGIWRGARFREERYAAIELSGHRAAKAFQTLDQLELYQELIVTGAWWDYVDQLASHRVGNL